MDEKKQHWERIYKTKSANQMSWTQTRPEPSIDWILEAVPQREAAVIDVGGGNSILVDYLLEAGYARPTVLDISGTALTQAKNRLGKKSSWVDWLEEDVTSFRTNRKFSLWHDRAVFHFLTKQADRVHYVDAMKRSLTLGGHAIIGAFSMNGPDQCSGFGVLRFDERSLAAEIGEPLKLIRSARHSHLTPTGVRQEFVFCLFRFA